MSLNLNHPNLQFESMLSMMDDDGNDEIDDSKHLIIKIGILITFIALLFILLVIIILRKQKEKIVRSEGQLQSRISNDLESFRTQEPRASKGLPSSHPFLIHDPHDLNFKRFQNQLQFETEEFQTSDHLTIESDHQPETNLISWSTWFNPPQSTFSNSDLDHHPRFITSSSSSPPQLISDSMTSTLPSPHSPSSLHPMPSPFSHSLISSRPRMHSYPTISLHSSTSILPQPRPRPRSISCQSSSRLHSFYLHPSNDDLTSNLNPSSHFHSIDTLSTSASIINTPHHSMASFPEIVDDIPPHRHRSVMVVISETGEEISFGLNSNLILHSSWFQSQIIHSLTFLWLYQMKLNWYVLETHDTFFFFDTLLLHTYSSISLKDLLYVLLCLHLSLFIFSNLFIFLLLIRHLYHTCQ